MDIYPKKRLHSVWNQIVQLYLTNSFVLTLQNLDFLVILWLVNFYVHFTQTFCREFKRENLMGLRIFVIHFDYSLDFFAICLESCNKLFIDSLTWKFILDKIDVAAPESHVCVREISIENWLNTIQWELKKTHWFNMRKMLSCMTLIELFC